MAARQEPRPQDTISSTETIDFTASPWPQALARCAQVANSTARQAALNAGTPNKLVPVNTTWFMDNAAPFDTIVADPRKAQAMIIASRGQFRQPCEVLCAKDGASRPFKDCIVLDGHFANACANCQVRDWRARCNHNRKCTRFVSRTTGQATAKELC
jgi:hypothetical protein